MAKAKTTEAPTKKSAAEQAPAKKPTAKKAPSKKRTPKKSVPFERTYKLLICRKIYPRRCPVVEYWRWGNRWSSDKKIAYNFARDFDASLKMVEHSISHGKVIENRDA